MREVLLARRLADLVCSRVSEDMFPSSVVIEAGALWAIDPVAMDAAWQLETADTELEDASVALVMLPWTLACDTCGRDWTGGDVFGRCSCGSWDIAPKAAGELHLVALEFNVAPPRAPRVRRSGPVPSRPAPPDRNHSAAR